MISRIVITIDDQPKDGFYLEHFDVVLKKVENLLSSCYLESYTVDGLPDPRLDPPSKENIADYKAYHAGEGVHTP